MRICITKNTSFFLVCILLLCPFVGIASDTKQSDIDIRGEWCMFSVMTTSYKEATVHENAFSYGDINGTYEVDKNTIR